MIARLTHSVVFRQILLAALLKLCNAAETFFRDQRKILWDRAEKGVLIRSVRRTNQGFAAGSLRRLNRPPQLDGRCACFFNL
jgi:hypothetical protein